MKKEIFIADEQTKFRLRKEILRRIIKDFFKIKNVSFGFSLVLADNRLIKKLNRRYLKRNYATDVLAFPLSEDGDRDNIRGEIVISLEKAWENALLFSQKFEEEITLYIIHGLLHLLGYRDYPISEARRMRKEERRIFQIIDKRIISRLVAKKV